MNRLVVAGVTGLLAFIGLAVRAGTPAIAAQATALLVTMASRVLLHEHYLTDALGAVLGVAGIGLLGIAVAARQPVSAP